MRIQLAAGIVAGGFAAAAPLSPVERALLLLCVFAVIGAEAANTALEAAVDLAQPERSEGARLAKDAAAGAVLALAAGSVAVLAAILEGSWDRLLAVRSALALPAAATLGVAITGAFLAGPIARPALPRQAVAALGAFGWGLLLTHASSLAAALVPGLLLALCWAAAPATRR
jgi:diacylglycerol kinase